MEAGNTCSRATSIKLVMRPSLIVILTDELAISNVSADTSCTVTSAWTKRSRVFLLTRHSRNIGKKTLGPCDHFLGTLPASLDQ